MKGIVYEDMNGLTNSTVDGTGSNAGGTLFAMLVDGAGNLVDSFPVKDDGTFILGGAAANTTYTVRYVESLAAPIGWRKLADVVASPESRTVVVTDTGGNAQRYYRLVTPAQP